MLSAEALVASCVEVVSGILIPNTFATAAPSGKYTPPVGPVATVRRFWAMAPPETITPAATRTNDTFQNKERFISITSQDGSLHSRDMRKLSIPRFRAHDTGRGILIYRCLLVVRYD